MWCDSGGSAHHTRFLGIDFRGLISDQSLVIVKYLFICLVVLSIKTKMNGIEEIKDENFGLANAQRIFYGV